MVNLQMVLILSVLGLRYTARQIGRDFRPIQDVKQRIDHTTIGAARLSAALREFGNMQREPAPAKSRRAHPAR